LNFEVKVPNLWKVLFLTFIEVAFLDQWTSNLVI